jgi:hypothetical protein
MHAAYRHGADSKAGENVRAQSGCTSHPAANNRDVVDGIRGRTRTPQTHHVQSKVAVSKRQISPRVSATYNSKSATNAQGKTVHYRNSCDLRAAKSGHLSQRYSKSHIDHLAGLTEPATEQGLQSRMQEAYRNSESPKAGSSRSVVQCGAHHPARKPIMR